MLGRINLSYLSDHTSEPILHKKTVLVKERHFYVKKLLFYELNGCKNTAFLQKYIFVTGCINTAFLCKKKLLFYKLTVCKNTAFLQIERL